MIYLPYIEEQKKIKTLYVLYLYGIAEYNKITKCYDTITDINTTSIYNRLKQKYNTNISKSTVNRFLDDIKNDKIYSVFFHVDEKENKITLNNNFKGKKNVQFITLDKQLFDFLVNVADDLLCKYVIYLKYNCGKTGTTDSTANQILSIMGYSTKSGQYKSKLAGYNTFLTDNQIIKINKYRDNLGKERNIYSF